MGEARAQPQKNGLKNGFDSYTRTIAARVVVKADLLSRSFKGMGKDKKRAAAAAAKSAAAVCSIPLSKEHDSPRKKRKCAAIAAIAKRRKQMEQTHKVEPPTGTMLAAATIVLLYAAIMKCRHNRAHVLSHAWVRPQHCEAQDDSGVSTTTITPHPSDQAYGTLAVQQRTGAAKPLTAVGSTEHAHVPMITTNTWSDATGAGQFQFDV